MNILFSVIILKLCKFVQISGKREVTAVKNTLDEWRPFQWKLLFNWYIIIGVFTLLSNSLSWPTRALEMWHFTTWYRWLSSMCSWSSWLVVSVWTFSRVEVKNEFWMKIHHFNPNRAGDLNIEINLGKVW